MFEGNIIIISSNIVIKVKVRYLAVEVGGAPADLPDVQDALGLGQVEAVGGDPLEELPAGQVLGEDDRLGRVLKVVHVADNVGVPEFPEQVGLVPDLVPDLPLPRPA